MKKKFKINEKENYVKISIDPKIYPLDVIYSAAYVFLDKAYILIDGNPEKAVDVELRGKEGKTKQGLGKLGREFFNELLNYAFYKRQGEKTAVVREAIVQRALITNDLSVIERAGKPKILKLKDTKGIAIPWEKGKRR